LKTAKCCKKIKIIIKYVFVRSFLEDSIIMILACNHISKAFADETVLSDAVFHINEGERAAIVGI